MKTQFAHNLLNSFYLWFERELLGDKSKAYKTNQSNTFKYVDFPDVPNSHLGYQGQFRQLVADHCVDQPNSGIFIDGSFVSGDSSDVYIDYNGGRVIVPAASGTGLNITANNTIKEVNTYVSSDDEEQLLVASDFVDASDLTETYLFSKDSKLDEKTYILPACFIRLVNNENEDFTFGGQDESITRIRVTILATDNYLLDGIVGLFSDTNERCITHVPFENSPFGHFYSIKDYPYCYEDHVSSLSGKTYVKEVKSSKTKNSFNSEKIEKNIYIGFLDFDLSTYRYPRV
tara:strand:+ start:26871 stop:27734 length:864 start_codon:yes stop_codon:yes gene_type:complete